MYPEVVQQIHADFDIAGDVLLAEAQEIVSKSSVSSKMRMLEEIGFSATPEYKRLKAEQTLVESKSVLVKAINDLKVRYPFHKVIDLQTVLNICRKYRLVYGKLSLFKGFIPAKNLKEIANFKKSYPAEYTKYVRRHVYTNSVVEVSKSEYTKKVDNPGYVYTYEEVTKPLWIAAPETDMNMTGKMIVDFKVVNKPIPPDPIVMFPVKSNGLDLFLVLTKWGDESEADELKDAIMN